MEGDIAGAGRKERRWAGQLTCSTLVESKAEVSMNNNCKCVTNVFLLQHDTTRRQTNDAHPIFLCVSLGLPRESAIGEEQHTWLQDRHVRKETKGFLVFGVDGIEGHLVGLNGAEVSQVALRWKCDV